MTELLQRYGKTITALIFGTTAFWLLMLVILPYLLMAEYSFHPNLPMPEQGGPNDHYTLANYATLFSGIDLWHWDFPDDFRVFIRTIWGGSVVTALCFAVCYPVAYYLVMVATPQRAAFLLLLLVIPYWINEILRVFAWYIILGYSGPLNAVLTGLHLIASPVRWLSGSGGVLIGMTYAYILFMMFPLHNAIDSLDKNQIEAARDLGAAAWRIHLRVVIPHAKPGIAVGCIMVFVLSVSSYIVPAVLGSPGTRWFTETIVQWFFEAQNWPLGAAYSFILLALCTLFILVVMRLFKVGLADIAK